MAHLIATAQREMDAISQVGNKCSIKCLVVANFSGWHIGRGKRKAKKKSVMIITYDHETQEWNHSLLDHRGPDGWIAS